MDQQQAQAEPRVSTGAVLGQDSFEFEGKTYRLGNLALDVEVAFETYLKCEAAKELDAVVTARTPDGDPMLSPATIDAMLAGLRADLAAHRWAFEGWEAYTARTQPRGEKELIFLRLQYHNRGKDANRVTRKAVDRLYKDREKLQELRARFEAIDNPNPTTPEAEGADA
jgi:hypothetical protein